MKRTNNIKSKLTESESYLRNYIKNNINLVKYMTITELSEKSLVSVSTIFRTMNKLGYSGYTEFKQSLKAENNNKVDFKNFTIKEAIEKNKNEALYTINMMKEDMINTAVNTIRNSERILIFARGSSTFVGQELNLKLLSLDFRTEIYDDPNFIITKSEKLDKKDVAIFISLNGNTKELVHAMNNCMSSSTKTILFTTNKIGRLSKLSNIVFTGYQAIDSNYPEYDLKSRIPLMIMTRVITDVLANK